jgi:SPP1 gp7 family putative phage head morphogenesis protein
MPSYTRDASYGPRNIKTATKRFEQRLRGVLERINAEIRKAIIERDIFGLNIEALEDDEPDSYSFTSDSKKVAGFTAWLARQLESEYLSVVGSDENEYIRKAYSEGLRRTARDLASEGVDISSDVDGLLDTFTHREALQDLYTRTFEELRSVTRDMAEAIRDELSTGLVEGENPRKVAKRLTDRVDSIGKYRSTLIARTEMMEAHSNAQLNRLETVQRDSDVNVTVKHATWETARDDRVCSICKALKGIAFTTDELRNGSFRLDGYDYQLRPPAHPMGRCHIQTQVGFDPEDLPPLEDRMDDFEAFSV